MQHIRQESVAYFVLKMCFHNTSKQENAAESSKFFTTSIELNFFAIILITLQFISNKRRCYQSYLTIKQMPQIQFCTNNQEASIPVTFRNLKEPKF